VENSPPGQQGGRCARVLSLTAQIRGERQTEAAANAPGFGAPVCGYAIVNTVFPKHSMKLGFCRSRRLANKAGHNLTVFTKV
jgi:hypothetical protein